MAAYDFSPLKSKGKEIQEWLKKEYLGIRTGQASPALLDGIIVEAYGVRMPLNQVGTVVVEDPRTLLVTPWDDAVIKAIEKALRDSDLGASIAVGEREVRVAFPDLTAERRQSLVKILRQKEEHAKVSLRAERERVWDDIQKKERAGELTEDDKYRLKEEMQKIVDEHTKELKILTDRKEKDVLEH